MNNKRILYLLPVLTFVIGILSGRIITQKSSIVREEAPVMNSSKVVHSKKIIDGAIEQKIKSKKCECYSIKATAHNKEEVDDGHFDEYEWQEEHDKSITKWNNSVLSLFKENTENPKEVFESYQTLKNKLKKESGKHWDEIMKKNKISENSYLGTSTFQDDLKEINIKKRYHQKLEKLLGNTVYKELQEMIRLYHRRRVEDARNGKTRRGAAHISF